MAQEQKSIKGCVTLKNIGICYSDKNIFENLNLELHTGEKIAIFGKSGIGKTSLAGVVLGLVKPAVGTVSVRGTCSRVFQENRLAEDFSAAVNIRRATGKSRREIYPRLQAVGIDRQTAQKPIKEYSGGMKRRVAIVRRVVANFDILVLDEPFTGIDRDTKKQCADYINKNLNGRTLLLITHSPDDAQLLNRNSVDFENLIV